MPKLWTFGDSFTAGHGMNGEIPEYPNADSNAIWPILLSNKLNFDLENLSKNGMTVESIVNNVLNCIDKFKPDDIVIIESSMIGRFDVPSNDVNFDNAKLKPIQIHANLLDTQYNPYLKHFTKSEYGIIISFFETFILDGYYYNASLTNLLNICKHLHKHNIVKKVIYWNLAPITTSSNLLAIQPFKNMNVINPFYLKSNGEYNSKDFGWARIFYEQKLTITADTNGKVVDEHPSKYGHFLFSELLYSAILNNKII